MDSNTLHHRNPTRHTTTTTTTTTTKENTNSSSSPPNTFNNALLRIRESAFVAMRYHTILCLLVVLVVCFTIVEYRLVMIPSSSPPFDLGFFVTKHLNSLLANNTRLNTILAFLNTVFIAMEFVYIFWTWVVEGRPRATLAMLLMLTFRGILGYSTQFPVPKEYLGSADDFPVGNASFFFFYSGHVATSVISALDMRRMQRSKMAFILDVLNILQIVRLSSTRGHYSIDIMVGGGVAILCDFLAATYIQGNNIKFYCNGACKTKHSYT